MEPSSLPQEHSTILLKSEAATSALGSEAVTQLEYGDITGYLNQLMHICTSGVIRTSEVIRGGDLMCYHGDYKMEGQAR